METPNPVQEISQPEPQAAQTEQPAQPHPAQPDTETKAESPTHLSDVYDAMMAESRDAALAKELKQQAREAEEARQDAEAQEDSEDSEHGPAKLPKPLQKYPQERVAEILGKFGIPESQLANKHVVELVKSKLEADALIADLKASKGDEATEDAENNDGEQEQAEARNDERQESSQQPPEHEAAERHAQQIIADIKQFNSPENVQAFRNELAAVFGADSPEAAANCDRLTNVILTGAHSLLATAVPALIERHLGNALESVMPGLGDMYRDAMLHNIWSDAKNSDAAYKGFPDFGSPEFYDLAEKVHAAHPWLSNFDLRDPHGNPLPVRDALMAKAKLTCRLIAGEKITPETLKASFEKGKAEANRSNKRVSAGRALGAGRSTGQIAPAHKAPEGGSLMDAWKSRHGGGF